MSFQNDGFCQHQELTHHTAGVQKGISAHLGHVGNQISPLLLLLDACKNHLGTRDVLLGVQQILEQVLV